MTRDLMAPEGYVIEAMVRGLGDHLTQPKLRKRVVSAYAHWQRIPSASRAHREQDFLRHRLAGRAAKRRRAAFVPARERVRWPGLLVVDALFDELAGFAVAAFDDDVFDGEGAGELDVDRE